MATNSKKLAVHAYKFNGWLYRTGEFPSIIKETDDYICVSSQNAHVITASEKDDRFYHSRILRPTIGYFFKDKGYNMIVAKKANKFYYYFNIAGPYIIEDAAIKYIDFDLDFRIPDIRQNTINELDLDEFKENTVKYKYPLELLAKIKEVEIEIQTKFRNGDFQKFLDLDLIYQHANEQKDRKEYHGKHRRVI